MTLIRRPNPFGELMSLRQAMDRLFEDSFVRPNRGGGSDDSALALDVYTTPDSLVVEAALPGVKPDDLDISVLGDTLTITATTSADETRDEGGYSHREIRRGSFTRTVTLPSGLKSDAATASFENGLLRLSFPKAEEARPRQIQIKPTTEGQASTATAAAVGAQGTADSALEADQSAPEANSAPGDWQSTKEAESQPHNEWRSTNDWQAGDQWQSGGQAGNGQTNEQTAVEQPS